MQRKAGKPAGKMGRAHSATKVVGGAHSATGTVGGAQSLETQPEMRDQFTVEKHGSVDL